MAKGKTRRASRSKGGLFSALWSPIKHLFMASGESASKLGSTAGKIVKESMKGVEGVGSSFARHSNQALGGITKKIRDVGKKVGRGVRKVARGVTGKKR
jgi:hypothetical protein